MKGKKVIAMLCAAAVAVSSISIPAEVQAAESGYTAAIEAFDKASMADTRKTEKSTSPDAGGGTGEMTAFTGNLALNKAVTASAESGSYLAAYAVDGDYDTDQNRWQSGDRSSWDSNVWIKVDLMTESTLTGIKMEFGRKMYANFQIQTSATGEDDGEWETLYTTTGVPTGDNQEIEYAETFETALSAKRYVRLYFTEANPSAGNKSIAIRELELLGTQEVTEDMLTPSTAAAALNLVTELTLDEAGTQVVFPDGGDYEISLKGSDWKQIVSEDAIVTNYNFYDYDVDVIVQAVNKNDETDRAQKSMVLHVDHERASYPELFPAVAQPNAEPKIIPSVQEWYGYTGDFVLSENTKIAVNDTHDLGLMAAAENLMTDLLEFTGWQLEIIEGAGGVNDIELCSIESDKYDTGEEGYILLNNDNGLKIYSHTYTGVFYGTMSVEQVFYQQRFEGNYSFPKGIMRDFPKFEVRGVMIDVARAPQRLERLYDYAKTLSFYKLNEFHVHLTDNINSHNAGNKNVEKWENSKNNEGYFRLESEAFPSLTSTAKSSDYYNDEDGAFGGQPQYSKEEYRAFQEDAAYLGVNILSEIDTPGHSLVINKYIEEHQDEVAQYGISGDTRRWVGDGVYANGGRDTAELLALSGENYENAAKFVRVLWDEYLGIEGNDYVDFDNQTVVNEYDSENAVFIGDRVHIGADEYWDITNDERQGMLDYIKDISEKVEATGKTARIWSEFAKYIDPLNMTDAEVKALGITDIEIDMWANNSHENTQKRLAQGFKIVNVDEAFLYGNTGRDRRDIVNVEYLFETWTPYTVNGYTIPKGEPGLLGAKTALWADVNRMGVTERDVNERVVRGASVLAEKIWGGTDDDQDFTEFSFKYSRLENGPGVEVASDIESKTDLIVHYDFANMADGTLYDVSGNEYDAEVSGGSVAEENGTTWLVLDGDTEVTTPIDSLDYPYTIQFSVKADNAANIGNAVLFDGYDGRLSINENGKLVADRAFFHEEFAYTAASNTKADVTIVGTQQVTKLYVDGVFKDAIIRTSAAEEDFNNVMGTFVFPLETIGTGFHGKLADIKVYRKAMSAAEVKAEYDGDAAVIVNVSQNKGVAGEGRVSGGHDNADQKLHVAWKAIDGDGNTLNGTHAATESDKDSYFYGRHADSFIALDFYEVHQVSEIHLEFDSAPSSYTLWESGDGENWTQIGDTYTETVVKFDAPVETQYLKLAANNFQLREIEVFEAVDKEGLQTAVETAAKFAEENGLSYTDKKKYEAFFDTYKEAESMMENRFAVQTEVDAVKATLNLLTEKAKEDASHEHAWSAWTTKSEATVFAKKTEIRKCSCGEEETREVGTVLKPAMTTNAKSNKIVLKKNQKSTGFRITGLAKGDSIVSIKSSNDKVVKVSGVNKAKGTCTLKAGKLTGKKGKATITITLKSGLKKVIKVTVQSSAVKTTSIAGLDKKLTLKKGKSVTLKPVLVPFTSQDKVKFTSSKKSVAAVSSKGQIKAKKKGSATITVKAGKKTVKVKVTVK